MPPVTRQKPPSGSHTRPHGLTLRMSPEELQLFRAVAVASGSSLVELVRVALLTEANRLGIEPEHQEAEAVA